MTTFIPFLDAFDHTFDIMVENLTEVYLEAKITDNNLLRSGFHFEEIGTLASQMGAVAYIHSNRISLWCTAKDKA